MMEELRKQILLYLEKHSRVDLGELAVLLGTDEVTVANEISAMERAKIICGYHLVRIQSEMFAYLDRFL